MMEHVFDVFNGIKPLRAVSDFSLVIKIILKQESIIPRERYHTNITKIRL